MRSRNIKPGFYRDADLAECSVQARYIVPGLWMMADREGRLKDNPRQIKMDLCPCDPWDVDALLDELAKVRHIIRYVADGQRVIQIRNFVIHQRPHPNETPSRLPPPPKIIESESPPDANNHETTSGNADLQEEEHHDTKSHVITRALMKRHDGSCKNVANPSDILNPLPESITKHKNTSCFSSEPAGATPRPPPPDRADVVIAIPLIARDGEFHVTEQDVKEWQETFPAVDVRAELRKIRQWSRDHPKRRKTRNGIRRHISSWLSREQDKGKKATMDRQEEKPLCQRALN